MRANSKTLNSMATVNYTNNKKLSMRENSKMECSMGGE